MHLRKVHSITIYKNVCDFYNYRHRRGKQDGAFDLPLEFINNVEYFFITFFLYTF